MYLNYFLRFTFQTLAFSKWAVNDSVKASAVNFNLETNNPEELYKFLLESEKLMERVSYNHAFTSTASTASQFVAMSIFLEGKSGNFSCIFNIEIV